MDIKWLEREFPDLKNFKALAPSGQKEVFSADHKAEGPVVLKIFKPGSNAERIEREMKAPLKVKSARVPVVAELGRKKSSVGEVVWLREKKIDGQSLRDLLAAKGKLDVAATIKIGLHILEVLEAAETAGIVHRDVKPGNTIIAPDGSAWVIDFGLARHLDQESLTATADKCFPCTPGYAPIEQFTNQKKDIDARADLFALGVTLFECLEGKNPFIEGTKNPKERIDRVMNTSLPRVTRKDVPKPLVDLIDAMTRPKAEHRISTAAEALKWMQEIGAAAKVS